MVLKKIDLNTTAITLDELLAELDCNTEVLLTRGTAPVARITPTQAPIMLTERVLGLHEGQGWISDDFTDELPTSFWLGDDE